MAKPIMILGASSNAGKTTLVAGICRVLANRGIRVAPFKTQNMALNSFVTSDNLEIGRSTAVQAYGARTEPHVHMNPILLKPKNDRTSQLIIHGKPFRDVSAADYFDRRTLQQIKWDAIDTAYAWLSQEYEQIVAEGAGSCAEPNLRDIDIVNMAVAHRIDADVYIAVDIDKGGAFADILGILEVMKHTVPEDLNRIKGFIINKFRGDASLLTPAIEFVEKHGGYPVIGIVPYIPLRLEEEDQVKFYQCDNPEIDIAILYLPHISNANDFDFLAMESGVQVRYVRHPQNLGSPDALIIPGSKNTTGDLKRIRQAGFEAPIKQLAQNIPVLGICGGFQMLGMQLHDPQGLEHEPGSVPGFGLLDCETTFYPGKKSVYCSYQPTSSNPFAEAGTVSGYEIHAGLLERHSGEPLFMNAQDQEGCMHESLPIYGTFIHDLFKNSAFTRAFVNDLRKRRHLPPLSTPLVDVEAITEESYEKLAETLENCLGLF